MKKAIPIVIALLVIGGVIGFVVMDDPDKESQDTSNTSTQTETNEDEATHTETELEDSENVAGDQVEIEDFAFTPANITVKKGTTVTWTNRDSTEHTVTPDEDGTFEDSGLLAQGESYSVTFDEVGTFSYHCQPHPQMTGTVVVTE